jgi:hypothetical protein
MNLAKGEIDGRRKFELEKIESKGVTDESEEGEFFAAVVAAAIANPQAHTCTSLNAEITLFSKAWPLLINQAFVSGKGIATVPAIFNAPPLFVSWPGRGPLRLKRDERMGPFSKRNFPRMLLIDVIAFIANIVMKCFMILETVCPVRRFVFLCESARRLKTKRTRRAHLSRVSPFLFHISPDFVLNYLC